MANQKLIIVLILSLANMSTAGPLTAGICYAGCAGIVCACFTAAGAVFGVATAAAISASPLLTQCNLAFAKCMALCAAAVTAPTP